MEECFDNIQNLKKLKSKEDWAELRPKRCLLKDSWAKYLGQIEKSNKTGKEEKSFISTFACFLVAIAKV